MSLLKILNQMSVFLQKPESSQDVQRVKQSFSDNPGHKNLQLFNVLVQVLYGTWYLVSYYLM